MDGSLMGTSIQDLHQSKENNDYYYENIRKLQNMNRVNYNAKQNMQFEQGHNAEQQMHEAQHAPYYDSVNCTNYPQFNQPTKQMPGYLSSNLGPNRGNSEMPDIEELARDINENLPEDNFASVSESGEEISHKHENRFISGIPKILREPLLILLIYIVMSQSVVRESLGKYFNQLNPDSEGKISFWGILIYGIIIAVIYAILKKFILE